MIDKIAEVIAKAVVPRVMEEVKKELEEISRKVDAEINRIAEESLRNAIKVIDRNKDGRIGWEDLR